MDIEEGTQVKIKDIIILPDLQIRMKISSKTVDEYAAAMAEGVKFRAIDLFRDDQDRLIVADGVHRFMAASSRELRTILAIVHECPPAEAMSKALEMSLERNCHHGLKMSAADKRNAVTRVLSDTLLRRKADRQIALMCGVSPGLVASVRKGEPTDTVDVGSHKRDKPKPPTPTEEEVVEDSDPVGERVRTLREWIESGKISWPEIAGIFTNDARVALLLPRKKGVVRIISKKATKDFKFKRCELIRNEDKTQHFEIELEYNEGE